MIDPYNRDLDADGIIDLLDIDDQDPNVQSVSDLVNRERSREPLNDRLDSYIHNSEESTLCDKDWELEK